MSTIGCIGSMSIPVCSHDVQDYAIVAWLFLGSKYKSWVLETILTIKLAKHKSKILIQG